MVPTKFVMALAYFESSLSLPRLITVDKKMESPYLETQRWKSAPQPSNGLRKGMSSYIQEIWTIFTKKEWWRVRMFS